MWIQLCQLCAGETPVSKVEMPCLREHREGLSGCLTAVLGSSGGDAQIGTVSLLDLLI